ncbi:MAG: hypothetical protein FJZ75_05725 [Bacteroidetes bacterium]|nr:hypothetical protein [Bacteroidota bacterium]
MRKEPKHSPKTTSTGRKIDFQQFRRREPAGMGTFLRMLTYALIISGMAFGLMELLQTLGSV